MEDWIFGCDICQEVCPWNRFSSPHEEQAFMISDELKNMSTGAWEELTDEVFQKLFEKSPVRRTGYEGLVRNIRFVGGKDS
jgi:epoxyqueuosine reductase